ncbi:MAG TPA: hypothetical protein VNA04_09225 [Thermoanaerobaculia bacterium]|nr:hypothetical protein [Thermoanaerobaculia bacterium]
MRRRNGKKGGVSLLQRAVSSLAQALSRRGGREAQAADVPRAAREGNGSPERRPRRRADIPLDQLAGTYTPTQTSLKAGFRSSGEDRLRDQEFARGLADERWSEEDRYTNKSGDPRIGTHGRTYEPGENKE